MNNRSEVESSESAAVLGIDPGHTIGFALATSPEISPWALLVRYEALSERILTSVVKMAQPAVVIIEGLPSRHIEPITQQVYLYLVKWFTVAGYRVHIVGPGRYKSSLKRTQWSATHARDASDLARWACAQPDAWGAQVELNEVMRIS